MQRGWACVPGFLSDTEARELSRQGRADWEDGEFRQAGVGRGAERVVREDLRRDYVRWLEPESGTPAEECYLARLDALREAINRETFLGLFAFEGHFAIYPPGGFYKAHLDRHRGTMDRIVTVILYLNDGWQPEDGGQLKLWTTPGDRQGETVTIDPTLGTLVAFLSGDHWHEVLPAHRERKSITGWFRVREA